METIRSFQWGFQTGAWRDVRVIQVVFQNFPQAVLQAYIIFRQWNENVDFSFTPTIVSLSCAILNVCFVPDGSPCFEDNRSLVVVSFDIFFSFVFLPSLNFLHSPLSTTHVLLFFHFSTPPSYNMRQVREQQLKSLGQKDYSLTQYPQ